MNRFALVLILATATQAVEWDEGAACYWDSDCVNSDCCVNRHC